MTAALYFCQREDRCIIFSSAVVELIRPSRVEWKELLPGRQDCSVDAQGVFTTSITANAAPRSRAGSSPPGYRVYV
jgi:hypothetical protein